MENVQVFLYLSVLYLHLSILKYFSGFPLLLLLFTNSKFTQVPPISARLFSPQSLADVLHPKVKSQVLLRSNKT